MCGPLRRDSQVGISKVARQARHQVEDIEIETDVFPWSHFGGVKPLGARSFGRREATLSGHAACVESEKVHRRERQSHRRTNETRVLEIEAVDGRSRSYASRVQGAYRRKAVCGCCTLTEGLRGNRADAAHGKIQR
jgi:hypothetical protein